MVRLTVITKGCIITFMDEIHQKHRDELDVLLNCIIKTKDMRIKSTLWKFYNSTRLIWVELDTEMIQCRRRKKLTQKYTELEAQYAECIKNFEQWNIFAALIY